MLKKTLTYTDYDGKQRTEDHYFNLGKVEAMELAMDMPDDVNDAIDGDAKDNIDEAAKRLVEKLGGKGILNYMKDLIAKSYGVKSEDGRRFIKNPELFEEFQQTPAYDALIIDLMTDETQAAAFVNGVLPPDLAATVAAIEAKKNAGNAQVTN